jgi:DNA-binding MarR family transcriptional regulator
MDIEPITLCRIVDRLEEAKLVERRRDPGDRRAWQVFLTPAAEPLLAKLHALAARMGGFAFAGLDDTDIARLAAALTTIRANVATIDEAFEPKRVQA